MGACFLYGTGGGKRYRVSEVYGGQNPPAVGVKEGDIFLRTDVAISGGEISANIGGMPTWEVPDGPWYIAMTTGVFPDNSRSAYFVWDTQKAHSVSGFPGPAYVRENGQWRRCEGYIFHNNGWLQFSWTYTNLTHLADQCAGVTGGWTGIRYYWDSYACGLVPGVSWASDGMHLTPALPTGPGGLIVTNSPVNLTEFNRIVINCSAVSGNAWCKISTGTGDGFHAGEVATVTLAAGVNVLDISSLSGAYYIGLACYVQGSLTVIHTYLQ